MGEAGQRLLAYDGTFFQGAKSDCDPSQLPLGYYWSGINMLNLGGTLSCRPGYRCLAGLPPGNLQGATIFRASGSVEQIIFVIDGLAYATSYPFQDFRQIPGIQLSPTARQVYWALTVQSTERLSEDIAAAIRVIIPKSVLFIQDGGQTAPAWYDGSNAGHVVGNAFDTPSGGPMAWVGERLWVASDNQVFASDIDNPFSFREQIYLGGVSSFFFKSEVTAMLPTPSIESPQLMVFTEIDGSILQANIRDRTQWPTTNLFQDEVIQVGCLSQRSAISHYGQLVWFSPSGVAVFDPATAGKLTARLPVRDNEMMISKVALAEDLSLVAAGAFGQFLVMSVPAEDVYNKHTWVLNHASIATLNDESGPSWAGHWVGTRPVEWIYGQVANTERIYHVSVDSDGQNRLWEAFTPDRLDNGCPITWAFTTRAHFGQTEPVQAKLPGQLARFQWANVALMGIAEDLDIGMFYAGGTRGSFKQIMQKRIRVNRGSLDMSDTLTTSTQVFAFKPQSRVVTTEDANQQEPDPDTIGSCGVERLDIDNIDDCFQFLVVGQGPATVKYIRSWALTVPNEKSGDGTACEDEPNPTAVRFDGVGVSDPDETALASDLNAIPEQHFTSNQTVAVTQGGFTVVGIGYAESVISQEAADRVATIIATKLAESELQHVLPPTLSAGVGLEDVG